MVRKILHLDLDAFFCAVEEQRDAGLRGRPFAVGGTPDQRGVVASCSYPARRFGVHSALPMAQAVRLCPDLIIVPPRFDAYKKASRRVMVCLHRLTALVEQISIDEAFLDVSELPTPIETIGRQLQNAINQERGLPCSLGGATNKLVAKIANNIGKDSARKDGPPNAISIVLPGEEAAFLAALPVRELWGVGPKTADKLNALGIETIGDIARYSEIELTRRFGKNGADLFRRAQGIDERPIETEREIKSVSKETTFAHDVSDHETLRRALSTLSDGVSRHLAQHDLSGNTVKLKLRWADFTTLTRQTTLAAPVRQHGDIYGAAMMLFETTWTTGRPVRLIGVGVSGFEHEEQQLSLWDAPTASPVGGEKLRRTLDDLRERFGDKIVRRGGDLKR